MGEAEDRGKDGESAKRKRNYLRQEEEHFLPWPRREGEKISTGSDINIVAKG